MKNNIYEKKQDNNMVNMQQDKKVNDLDEFESELNKIELKEDDNKDSKKSKFKKEE